MFSIFSLLLHNHSSNIAIDVVSIGCLYRMSYTNFYINPFTTIKFQYNDWPHPYIYVVQIKSIKDRGRFIDNL